MPQRPTSRKRRPSPAILACTLPALLIPLALAHPDDPAPAVPIDFARDVRPILANRCFKCHGPDAAARESNLRLDTRGTALAPAKSGIPAVVPGDSSSSELIRRITSVDPDERMPPPEAGDALTPAEVEALRAWIDSGAPWARHWSLEPITRPVIPAPSARVRTDIDAIVLARLEREGLAPSPEVDRATLLRRMSLDLTGLPPTPGELADYLADTSPDADLRVIDRLLSSPRFGEHWARLWLDLARYADTKGYEADRRRTMWPYRDWVIRALNDDMPFDQFTIRQIAGDLLDSPTDDDRVATAFHRNTMNNDEGGTDDEEFRVAAVVDRVNTTMQVWMGLTMGCAQCHTHKYDPLTHTDYYRLFAFFNQTADADRPDESPTLALPTPDERARRDALAAEIDSLQSRLARARDALPVEAALADTIVALEAELPARSAELGALDASITRLPVFSELPPDARRATHRLERGSFLSPAESVTPGVPEALHPLPSSASSTNEPDRLDLARWLVAPDNPLTARVLANRVWAQLFGTGIVETLEDFGIQGAPPSHPELLDLLASDLVANAWSLKHLLRTILTSAVYRQSSNTPPPLLERDPANRLLARAPRVRLDAETIRDQALAVSGLLSPALFGPPVFPPQPDGVWSIVYSDDRWQTSTGDDRYRRSIYTFWRRTSPHPMLVAFDAPSREFCVPRRIRTNTPLQALATLNDPVFVEAAQALARRMIAQGGPLARDRAAVGVRLCLAREPRPAELDAIVDLADRAHARLRAAPSDALALATDPLGPLPDALDPVEAAAWTSVANVLLNLDEFLTKP